MQVPSPPPIHAEEEEDDDDRNDDDTHLLEVAEMVPPAPPRRMFEPAALVAMTDRGVIVAGFKIATEREEEEIIMCLYVHKVENFMML